MDGLRLDPLTDSPHHDAMTGQIEKTASAFGQAIADELAGIRRDMVSKDDLRSAVREILEVVNGNTLALREDLNRQFEKAGLPVKLDAVPRRKA